MSLTYLKISTQFGAVLRNLRKIEALIDHAVKADNANYNRRLLTQTNGFDQTIDAEARAYGKQLTHFDGPLQSALRTLWENYRAEIESVDDFFGVIDAGLGLSDIDLKAGAIEYVYDTTNGVISIVERRGFLGALYNDMIAQSQKVAANGVTAGSFTAKSGNRGLLTVSAMTYLSHTLSGTLVFEVIDESVDQPVIKVSLETLEKTYDNLLVIDADNGLNVDKAYEDGPTGLTAALVRTGLATPTESGDGGAIFSSTVIANPKEADMNGGVLQVRVTRQSSGDTWLIEFFNSSARLASNKVGSATTNTAVGTASLDVTLRNNTRFTATFDRAAAAVVMPAAGNTDDDISFDIETPRLGDRWTREITNDYVGSFSTKIAKAWRMSLPVTSGSQWTDSLANSISMT